MNKKLKTVAATMMAGFLSVAFGCNKPENNDVDPTFDNSEDIVRVTTLEPFQITMTSAACGGLVEADEDVSLHNARYGICWSKEEMPTYRDRHVYTSDYDEAFDLMLMDSLEPGTTYYVRAFVEHLTYFYGRQYRFTTLTEWGGGTPSTGYLNGVFSVSDTDKVRFSKGYLQYQASTNTCRFADEQYTIINDEENQLASENYNGWIDGFGLGTSGWYGGRPYYQPYDRAAVQFKYGPRSGKALGLYVYSDWGYYNAISNGGNQRGQWRVLTKEEFDYLQNSRTTPSGIRYANAMVNNVPGRIVLPDDWVSNRNNALTNPNTTVCYPYENTITLEQWTNYFEPNGAVFLAGTEMRTATGAASLKYYKPGPGGTPGSPDYTPIRVRLVHTTN